jgi:hypothetical protein
MSQITKNSSGIITVPVPVSNGGTGDTSFTPFAVITGGVISTGALQSVASVGTSGQVLTSNGTGALPSFQTVTSSLPASAVYGDGSDGTVTFDGTSVVLGITPSGSNYTLARDIFLNSSTINTGIGIITNGFRIFCMGTLTNNGTILWNGNAATLAVAGVALNNINSSISHGTNTTSPGTAGGAGNTGIGSNGINSGNSNFGGRGGTGGAGVSAAGVGGTVVATTGGAQGNIRSIPTVILGELITGAQGFQAINGGTGGGGGGGDGINAGGGGGGGAGIIILCVWKFSGIGNIQAIGGSGGNASSASVNAGGGGGGGGGLINILSSSVVTAAIAGQTISVGGGTGGTGSGSGATGSNGLSGTTIILFNS